MEELKEAGISKKVALTIGIAVDHRRTNKSVRNASCSECRLHCDTRVCSKRANRKRWLCKVDCCLFLTATDVECCNGSRTRRDDIILTVLDV